MRKRERRISEHGSRRGREENGAERGNARVSASQEERERERREGDRLDTTPRHDEVEERAQADRTHCWSCP